MRMCISENKANSKFTTEKYFSRKMLIFTDFSDIQQKFPDNSLIFQLKKAHFQIPWWFTDFPNLAFGRDDGLSTLRVSLSAEGPKTFPARPWVSLLQGYGSLIMTFLGKFGYFTYMAIQLIRILKWKRCVWRKTCHTWRYMSPEEKMEKW